jgi:4-diphosphocytidyl-2-C-methyl-D-erythritol kinase
MKGVLAIAAPAKINLHLEVLGRRPDGFHELRTLLQSIDLADRLELEPAPVGRLQLEVDPPGVVPVDGNLVLRAAGALWSHVGRRPGARLRLVKRIPAGGGLGGGSADAAAALVALDRLWGTGLGTSALLRLAAGLGSDVPFFLLGGLALGVGRGDEVYPLPDLGPLTVVVATPALSIPTPEVYGSLDRRLTWFAPDASVYGLAAGLSDEVPWSSFKNDLQPVVVNRWRQVEDVLRALAGYDPLHVSMTGSGSACYAVFADRSRAEAAAHGLDSAWSVHVGTTLARRDAALVGRRWEELEG